MPTQTHPLSQVAGDLFDLATAQLGVAEGSRFMFSGNRELAGRSPIEAIKAGLSGDVARLLLLMTETEAADGAL